MSEEIEGAWQEVICSRTLCPKEKRQYLLGISGETGGGRLAECVSQILSLVGPQRPILELFGD